VTDPPIAKSDDSSQPTGWPVITSARLWLITVGAIVVWLSWIIWPEPAASGLDASWQLVLGYAHVHRWQFGTDFVFTHGPWSFLNVNHSYEGTVWPEVAWQLFIKGLVAVAVGYLAFRLPAWRAIILLITAALLLPLFEDVAPVLLILFLTAFCAAEKRRSFACVLAIAILFGCLALQKFTYCMMIAVGSAGVISAFFLTRRPRAAGAFAITLAASACLFWLAAGQRLIGLPLFLRRSWQLASAYAETMYIEETWAVFWCGILTLVAGALAILMATTRVWRASRTVSVVIAGVAFVFAFMIWKFGFVRADGHVQGFFLCALGVGLVLQPVWSGLVLSAAGLLGFVVSSPALFLAAPAFVKLRLEASARALTSPAAWYARFERDTTTIAKALELPGIRARLREHPVDVFGDDHAVALLNGFSYTPRPVFQTYLAYSPALAELNARFYAGTTAPEFVLFRLQTIDNRFLPLDDARVLPILLQNYESVTEENGWRLLQRRGPPRRAPLTPIQSRRIQLGSSVALPDAADSLLAAQIEVRPTLLGRVRTFFYKAAEIQLTIDDGISTRSYRLVRPAAAGGFLVAPLLRDKNDLRDLLAGRTSRAPRRLIVDVKPALRKFYARKFTVRFATSPRSWPAAMETAQAARDVLKSDTALY
jgi:hypothetical protein